MKNIYLGIILVIGAPFVLIAAVFYASGRLLDALTK